MSSLEFCRELGQQLRVDAVRATSAAGSGHPTSCMSAADLMAVLFARHLRYDFDAPRLSNNDRVILSKGHAAALLYAMFKAAGAISDDELMTFGTLGSRLEGHPVRSLPWIDVATGSLGQGLPIGVGMALSAKYLERLPYRVWVLCGDSEMSEGSNWEAFEHASFYGLHNLTAVVDVNRLGMRGQTMPGWDMDKYAARLRAFGCHAIVVDGHDVQAIDNAYKEARAVPDRPSAILARTIKGRGVSAVEDRNGWHGRPLENARAAVEELGGKRCLHVTVAKPMDAVRPPIVRGAPTLPSWPLGAKIATRRAYGEALAALGRARGDVVALDAEVGNSTGAGVFAQACPDRFFEMYIAEQQMVGAAVGLWARGWTPFASTFSSFVSRAHDFIRMAAVGRVSIRVVASHAGVSVGEGGPSGMGLEDLAIFRTIHGSTVLYPCDANQTAQLVALMADREGISYLRTTRPATPVIYGPEERFVIGGSRVLCASAQDQVAIVAAGITVHEALAAAGRLALQDIPARVIDAYSVKPIDAKAIREAAVVTGGRLVVVEDHWATGGLGDAVLDFFAESEQPVRVVKLAVRDMPGSGAADKLMATAGIDAEHIFSAAWSLAAKPAAVPA